MRRCINFDEKQAEFVSRWVEQHKKEYRNFDAMEMDLPRAYLAFLNTPARWLGNVTPGAYFTQFEDPKDLVDWFCDYFAQKVPVPDLLLEQITAVGKPCEKRLIALLKDDKVSVDCKMTAVGLLRELESTQPKMLYIQWQLDRKPNDELAENAMDSLKDMGKSALQAMLEALPKANVAGQEALLDALVEFPEQPQVYKLAVRLFEENPDRRALFAGYLGKLGNDKCLPMLIAAAKDPLTSYVDFIELRNAIERLGGNAPVRDFDGDPDYEALHGAES